MINLKNKQFVKDNLPEDYDGYLKDYDRLLEILNKSNNLIKKNDEYYTDIDIKIMYKILISIVSEYNSCKQAEFSIYGLNKVFKSTGIDINIPMDMLYEVRLDMAYFFTKSEILEIVDFLDDLNDKLIVIGLWEMKSPYKFTKMSIESTYELNYSEEFKYIIKSIQDGRTSILPMTPGEINRRIKLIDRVINDKFSKRVERSRMHKSKLAYEVLLHKNRGKKVTINEIKKYIPSSEVFDVYHIYRGLYENKFPLDLELALKKGKHSYLQIDNSLVKEGNYLEEITNIDSKKQEVDSNVKEKQSIELEFIEGKSKIVVHEQKERNPKLINNAKILFKQKHGKVYCEVCNFDFEDIYGELGEGYIEAHHKIPISELNGEQETKIEDIALVCSNCHRMLHRKKTTISIEELKKIIKKN